MKVFRRVHEDMVTKFVDALPKFCLYCGSKCWPDGDYPYACRCSECSTYFHREFKTCGDIDCGCRDSAACTNCLPPNSLRLVELEDGRVFEVCQHCAAWLREEGYIDGDTEIIDAYADDSDGDV